MCSAFFGLQLRDNQIELGGGGEGGEENSLQAACDYKNMRETAVPSSCTLPFKSHFYLHVGFMLTVGQCPLSGRRDSYIQLTSLGCYTHFAKGAT